MPQPYFVPVRFSESRITQSKGVDGGSSTVTGLPLTVNEIKERLLAFEWDVNVWMYRNHGTMQMNAIGLGAFWRKGEPACAQRLCDKYRFRATGTKTSPGAFLTPRKLGRLKFVEPVERGHFVSFRERRVVENRVAEIFDGASVIHHGLPDVNNFGGALPDHVYAKQLARIAVEQQFQHAAFIAQHHAFGQLVVFRDPHFVGNFLGRKCFFRLPDHGNFRN